MGRLLIIMILIRAWIPGASAQDPVLIADSATSDAAVSREELQLDSTPGTVRAQLDSVPFASPPLFSENALLIEKRGAVIPSGVCNQLLTAPLKVIVTDQNGIPVEGIEVLFSLIDQPGQATGTHLEPDAVATDTSGTAATQFTPGSEPGTYHVTATIAQAYPQHEVIFKIEVRKKNWVYMLIIGLLGGLGLFLFGMHAMSEGMQKSAGARLRNILEMVTRNRIVGTGIGTLVTTVIQSSSATSVMLVSFVNASLLQFRQTIPVLLGAAIGTTITAQMIAFRITEYSLLLVAVGFFLQAFSKKEQIKSAGFSIFGFGVLFFGMHIMSDAMAPLREWAPFINLLLKLENPLIGILIGALFTALIQSSSAFIGIMIVLASQGLLSIDAAIPLLLGSNLGTPVTALLSSMKSGLEAKKVAVAFLLVKLVSVVIFAGWTAQLGKLLSEWAPDASLQRMIANAHTFINLVMTLVLLPVTPQLARLVDRIMGSGEIPDKRKFRTLYLDPAVIATPSLALELAKQEIMRMGNIVRKMVSLILTPFLEKDLNPLNEVYRHEKEINYLRDAIKSYLVRINSEAGNSEQLNESFQMLYTLNEFEKIADIISDNLASRAEKWALLHYSFSGEGKKELKKFHVKIEKQLNRALEVFEEMNLQKAAMMKAKHKEYRLLSQELEKQHYARILEGLKESIDSSETHLEVLALLSRIDSHVTNIARMALEWNQKAS
jgi:phosphate:Na+ symporter